MAASRKKSARTIPTANADDPMVNISATVPRRILEQVRERVGRRGLSAFISGSLERELKRIYLQEFIDEAIKVHGPLDEEEVERFRRLLGR